MFRRSVLCLLPSMRDLVDRLDSFEKEVIQLKAFRQAVEATSPEVSAKAQSLIEDHVKTVKATKANLDIPLTAEEFVDLNQFYAAQKCKKLLLSNMLYISKLGGLLSHAGIVHREYLVRVAQIARSLNNAPFGLSQMPSIQELKRWYEWTFHDMRNTPTPTDAESALQFDHLVRRVFLRHYNVSSLLSEGMLELASREQWTDSSFLDESLSSTFEELQAFFWDFCVNRVRLRFLVGNYMYLSTRILGIKPEDVASSDLETLTVPLFFGHDPSSFVGQICKECSLLKLLQFSITEAQRGYEDAEIELLVAGDPELTCVGIPYITSDIMAALIDDAVQANLQRRERFGVPCSKIVVTLAQRQGNDRNTVRISDTAGGMPLEATGQLLSYWSAHKILVNSDEECHNIKTWIHSPIRLPYAYCAARVFGGDITVASIEGYGTDRYLYLPAFGIDSISL